MPVTNIAVAGLESFQPAVDYKRSGRVGVLSGKNFAWDAAGVFSAYASRLVSADTSIVSPPGFVQELDLEDIWEVAVDAKIYRFVPSSPASPVGTWELLYTHPHLVESDVRQLPYDFRKWTSGYLGSKRLRCAYNYGVWDVAANHSAVRLTSGSVPGFPADSTPVIAVAETNGRMLYMTKTALYWSAPAAPTNLVPALGGAGFQVIAERIGGTPIALTPVSVGAIVWTTVGALVAEFIGGTTVFRFWQLATRALPLSGFAITRLPDDDYIILTRLGLFMFNNLNQPQPITPLFNEFLREYLRNRPDERGHLWYSINDNRVYISFRPMGRGFAETFALDVTLDRWGVFSESHLGMFSYGIDRGQIAYANIQGVVSFLLSNVDVRKNREDPENPGSFIGLASEITIGYMRAEALVQQADVTQELQEIYVNRTIPFEAVNMTYFDEGYVTDSGPDEFDEGYVTDVDFTVFDEGGVVTETSSASYKLESITDLFFRDNPQMIDTQLSATLAYKGPQADLWTLTHPAVYHRLRFVATGPDEFYRVNSLDLTVAHMGNIG